MFLIILEKTQATLLKWFASQQQTNTSRRQKLNVSYLRFISQFNEFRQVLKAKENGQKMAETKTVRKPQKCDIPGLRVNRKIKNQTAVSKEDPFVFS